MPRDERIKLIQEIEKERESKVICYITGDKPGFETRIAADAFRLFYDHLEKIIGKKKVPKLDLFIYTRGGDTMVPWRLVSLFKEYAKSFSVLIPFRAHSAGTLIALGANEIVMGKMGELSPVDPSVTTPFNPPNPGMQERKLDVSVEDVISYFLLAKEKVGLTEQEQLGGVFKALSEKVHPLALGNINRAHSQIRKLARQLLNIHTIGASKTQRIDSIVDKLTEKLFSHNYLICREEAKNVIGLKISYPIVKLEEIIWKLYLEYESSMDLTKPLNLLTLLGAENEKDVAIEGAFIESSGITDVFTTNMKVKKVTQNIQGPPGQPSIQRSGIQQDIIDQGWKRQNGV